MNRFVWDVRHSTGITAPTGAYQVRLKAGDATQTQPFKVLMDPRIAAEGVTDADLKEQYDHNMRMRELGANVAQLLGRVRTGMGAATGDKAAKLKAIYDQIVSTPEGIRYNKPGLQSHVQYLAGMTTGVDQKIGRDAIARYQTLKKQFETLKAQADALLGM